MKKGNNFFYLMSNINKSIDRNINLKISTCNLSFYMNTENDNKTIINSKVNHIFNVVFKIMLAIAK